MEITIHGVSHEGDGVGRTADGQVVFVEGGLPGDTVRVEFTTKKKKIQFGRVVDIVKPSEERVVSRCGVERCGGCALKSLSLEGQSSVKRERVASVLSRIAKIEFPGDFEFIKPESAWHYRHRVRMHAHWSGESYRIGFYARKSNDLVPHAGCPVLWPELDKFITRMVPAIHRLPRKVGLLEVEAVWSRASKRGAIRLVIDGDLGFFRGSTEWMDQAGILGLEIAKGDVINRFGNCELVYDQSVGDYSLSFETGTFTANPGMNDELIRRVVQAVQPCQVPKS